MIAYPLPTFPGKTQESLLGLLLRKKLEPNVEDWVTEGRKIASGAAGSGTATDQEREDILGLWGWAGMAANEEARQHTWGGNYTLEEKAAGIQSVVTGLRRTLKENRDDSSDEEETAEDENDEDDIQGGFEEDKMEIIRARRKSVAGIDFELRRKGEHTASTPLPNALPIDNVFRFMMTGAERQA